MSLPPPSGLVCQPRTGVIVRGHGMEFGAQLFNGCVMLGKLFHSSDLLLTSFLWKRYLTSITMEVVVKKKYVLNIIGMGDFRVKTCLCPLTDVTIWEYLTSNLAGRVALSTWVHKSLLSLISFSQLTELGRGPGKQSPQGRKGGARRRWSKEQRMTHGGQRLGVLGLLWIFWRIWSVQCEGK